MNEKKHHLNCLHKQLTLVINLSKCTNSKIAIKIYTKFNF